MAGTGTPKLDIPGLSQFNRAATARGGGLSKPKFYAWYCNGDQGIELSWADCRAIVSGRNARYRGFSTRQEAIDWLEGGAVYGKKKVKKQAALSDYPKDAIFFDAGTGRGRGTEVNVTDRKGVPIVHLAKPKFPLTEFGTVLLPKGKTNNFGELLGCFYALRIANANQIKAIYGDSDLVISYWSKNWVSAEKRSTDPDLALLAEWTAKELRTFNANGGSLKHIPGRINPADLGFHRD